MMMAGDVLAVLVLVGRELGVIDFMEGFTFPPFGLQNISRQTQTLSRRVVVEGATPQ